MSSNEIHTPRLILRRWTESDAEAMFEIAGDQIIGMMCGWRPHISIDDSIDFIKSCEGKDAYAIILRSNNTPIGCIEALRSPNIIQARPGDAELGYWIGVRYWNNGYATEAASALIEDLFENGVKRIWCQCREDNPASVRVQQKCRFVFDHKAVSTNPVIGNMVVEVCRLDKKDWVRVRCNAPAI